MFFGVNGTPIKKVYIKTVKYYKTDVPRNILSKKTSNSQENFIIGKKKLDRVGTVDNRHSPD